MPNTEVRAGRRGSVCGHDPAEIYRSIQIEIARGAGAGLANLDTWVRDLPALTIALLRPIPAGETWFGRVEARSTEEAYASPPSDGKMSAVHAFKVPNSELFFMLCNQFPHCRDKLMRDLHDCLVLFRKRSFILGHGFFRRLLLVVREDAPNSLFVPSRRKPIWGHICLVRLRLR